MLARMNRFILTVALLACASPAFAGARDFVLVNGTRVPLSELSIRRAGTQEWRSLAAAAPAAGGRTTVKFSNQDCAFDIRATVPGQGPVTWAGVNLCDVKSVTLNRDSSAGAWVDYDQH